MPIPIDSRAKPASVKVHITSGEGVEIVWADGRQSRFDFELLRKQCPCAACNDERTRREAAAVRGMAAASPIPGMGPSLPMFRPKVRAVAAKPVGNYAIQLTFSDGHSTGIYSFAYLRSLHDELAEKQPQESESSPGRVQ